MAKGQVAGGAIVARSAAVIVGRLDDRLEEMARSIQEILVIEIAELGDDAQLLELQRDTVEANVETVFSAIRHTIPIAHVEPPTAALDARRLAQRGVSANALVRAYRLGHQEVMRFVLDEIRASSLDPQHSLDVYEHIATIAFRYIDWISQQVVNAYQEERDRWLQNRNSIRAQRVREILDGTEVEVDAMTKALSYPLRRAHLALLVWYPTGEVGDELVRMERFINQLGQTLGAHDGPMFIPVDRVTGWAWIPVSSEVSSDATSHVVAEIRTFAEAQPDAPWIAAGSSLPGVDGFRRSHLQARLAYAVAIGSGCETRRITAASDPGVPVAALLGDNVAAARACIAEVLGPLAGRTDNDERLRETLRVFLGTGSSFKGAAEKLHLHTNSVKYRVQRAIERRGRPITDDRLDVEVALLLCHWFGPALLR